MKEDRKKLGASLVKDYDRRRDLRKHWDVIWQEQAQYIAPRRSNILVKRQPGARQTDFLFDSTAPNANETLAAALSGTLTSAADRWFSLKTRLEELNADPEVAFWLFDTAERMFLAFNQSNFDAEIPEVYLDLGAFGTGCIFIQEAEPTKPGFAGVTFTSVPIGSFVVAEDANGRVNEVSRRIEMTIDACVDKFGKENCSEWVQRKFEAGEIDEQIVVIHCVKPRKGPYGSFATRKPFASYYVEYEQKHVLSEGGFDEFPFMVPRWAKATGEIYGRGPGFTALPDIRSLNKIVELKLLALGKTVDPPLMVRDEGVIGRVNLSPAGLTYVRNLPSETIAPLISGGRFDITQIEEDQLRQSIRRMFFTDKLQVPDKQYMTAFEVEKQLELMFRILGPTMGRLNFELLQTMIDRVFGIMLRANQFLPLPPALIEANKMGLADIDVQYEGPLTRAQRGTALVGVQKAYELLMPLTQLSPEMRDLPDADKVGRFIWKQAGAPEHLLNSANAVKKVREGRAQDMAAAQSMHEDQVTADVVNKTSKAIQK